MSANNQNKQQGHPKTTAARFQTGKKSSPRSRPGRAIHATIEEYILDHKSQNHSPKTIEWHTLALGNLVDYLEQQGVTEVEQIERVHLLGWLNALSTQPGAKGKILAARSVNCYARSMRAFCRWLELQEYVQVAGSYTLLVISTSINQ